MSSFAQVHGDVVAGELTAFDRLIFKGHLMRLEADGGMLAFLNSQGVLLKDFAGYVDGVSKSLKAHAEAVAAGRGRPFLYLVEAMTKRRGSSKEDLAREIAARDGITEGLICVLSTVEPCSTFRVAANHESHRLEVRHAKRKCLHFYFYLLDAELGFMHVRLQSWFPFQIQIWVNGREWLCRQLERGGVGYQRWQNAIVAVDNLAWAQQRAAFFARRRWPMVLNTFARTVNPFAKTIDRANFGSYYWCADQAEIATDVLFRDRASLEAVWGDLARHASSAFGSGDVLRFLGRKLHPTLAQQVTTSTFRRPEGTRIKHAMGRNSIKVYDKANVLRVETTINKPSEFRVLRVVTDDQGRRQRRYMPMRKGVSDLWRFMQVGTSANSRYLDALSQAPLHGKARASLARLCRPVTTGGRRHPRIHPVDPDTISVFHAVLDGAGTIRGFKNHDIARRIYPNMPTTTPEERKRCCARVGRILAKLRGHHLIAKIPRTRRYRVTRYGAAVMTAAIAYWTTEYPAAFARAG